jgi:hypothetical protein
MLSHQSGFTRGGNSSYMPSTLGAEPTWPLAVPAVDPLSDAHSRRRFTASHDVGQDRGMVNPRDDAWLELTELIAASPVNVVVRPPHEDSATGTALGLGTSSYLGALATLPASSSTTDGYVYSEAARERTVFPVSTRQVPAPPGCSSSLTTSLVAPSPSTVEPWAEVTAPSITSRSTR